VRLVNSMASYNAGLSNVPTTSVALGRALDTPAALKCRLRVLNHVGSAAATEPCPVSHLRNRRFAPLSSPHAFLNQRRTPVDAVRGTVISDSGDPSDLSLLCLGFYSSISSLLYLDCHVQLPSSEGMLVGKFLKFVFQFLSQVF